MKVKIDRLELKIRNLEKEYMRFMEIKDFPTYMIKIDEVSQSEIDSFGAGSIAAADYKVDTNSHTLTVNRNVLNSDFLIFHEFTHILDAHQFAQGNKIIYLGITGFSEYHASQVGLVKLLGANTIDDVPNFTMNTLIKPFSISKTVLEYIEEKQQLAIDLFSKTDFPNDFETLKMAVGVLYNYWGIRSICEMYANDFTEKIKNDIFLNHISSMWFCKANNLMHGWFDSKKALASIVPFQNILAELLSQCKQK
ncbi:MAG: hypothetical protein IKT70_02305 [Clostridia bacterium]|nr:hypothetical protein [Clostridia bacterium]